MKKPLHERIAATKERHAQLAARLAALQSKAKAEDRKRDTRRKIVIGAAVLVEMERTPQFAKFVRTMLGKAVTRPQDRAAVADLLSTAAEVAAPASNANTPPPPSPSSSTLSLSGPSHAVTAREKAAG